MKNGLRRECDKIALHLTGVSGVTFCVFDAALASVSPFPYFCSVCNCCGCVENCRLGCHEADRWGGRYVYYCPAGFAFTSAPVFDEGKFAGGIVAGPLIMGDLEDTLSTLDDAKRAAAEALPVLTAARLRDLSEVLALTVAALDIILPHDRMEKTGVEQKPQFSNYEGIRYFADGEQRFHEFIVAKDRIRAQALLNDLLGHVYSYSQFDSGMFRERALALVTVLSRAVTDTTAEMSRILSGDSGGIHDFAQIAGLAKMNIWLTDAMHNLLNDVFDESLHYSDTVNKIIKYIRDNYSRKITLEEVAGQVFLSASYISSLFKEETGQNLTAYINHVRVEQSKLLLENKKASLSDIAKMCGFEDQSYFAKVFKRETGMTPNHYRVSRMEDALRRGTAEYVGFPNPVRDEDTNRKKKTEDNTMALMDEIIEYLQKGRARNVKQLVEQALEEGISPEVILNDALLHGMNVIGAKFKSNEVFVPEVLIAARAFNAALDVLRPRLAESAVKSPGTAIIGTVKGDLHDIGKNIVKIMLEGRGIKVIDLGVDVPAEKMVDAAIENGAGLICCSALLTTTMGEMRRVVELLADRGLRDRIKVMVGGAPVTQSFCDSIEADAYTKDAASAAEKAVELLTHR